MFVYENPKLSGEPKSKGFSENYAFPCVGAWDGFHIYFNRNLKNYCSFKKRYSITNLGLVGFNKHFLYAAVGAPANTHDARRLKESSIYTGQSYSTWRFRRDFTCYHWWQCLPSPLLKMYNQNTGNKQQRYFNRCLCGARMVMENAYGMLKGRRIFSVQKKCRLFNLCYNIMACIALHNICTGRSDPCQPRWGLEVEQLELMEKLLSRAADKEK